MMADSYDWNNRHKKKQPPAAEIIPMPPPNTVNGNSQYGAKALADELYTLANTSEGARNDQLNKAAFNLAQLVAAGHLDAVATQQQLRTTALMIGSPASEIDGTLRSAFRAGMQHPRQVPEMPAKVDVVEGQWNAEAGGIINPETGEVIDPKAGDAEERSTWSAVDLGPVLDGTWQPPKPLVGSRTDGAGLFYPTKCHTVIGETESAKTWFALSAAIDEMKERHHVLYIDFEDDEGTVANRLLTLGITRQLIKEYFHYVRPEMPLTDGYNMLTLRDLIAEYPPTLAILDGITEAMTMHGLNPLDNVDAAKFGHILPRRLAQKGPAVVSLDHVTKDREGRGKYAIGAVHKLNALDGAGYILENRTPFGVGVTGRSTIRIAKDRPAQLRKNALPHEQGYWYGDLVLKSHGEEYAEISIYPPIDHENEERPIALMKKISELLQERGPLSKNKIETAIRGNAQHKRQAITLLILDGYISDGDAQNPHQFIRPFLDQL